MQQVVTAAQLATELGCAKSSITRRIQQGLPTLPGGRLDRTAALEWLAKQISGQGGGWNGTRRGEGIGERSKRLLATEKGGRPTGPGIDFDSDYWRGALAMLNGLRRPVNTQIVAKLAVAYGATAATAWAIAMAYDSMLVAWGIPEGCEDVAGLVEFHDDVPGPDWARVAELAGEPLDLKAWGRISRKRMREFEKQHPNW